MYDKCSNIFRRTPIMITINKEKCIGCGLCAKDCFPAQIEIKDKKALALNTNCIDCGHCIAICPMNAVTLDGYDANEILEYDQIDMDIAPATYLNHLKGRRTIRNFKPTPVNDEALQMILDAGRFSPTGGNLQNVSYYVSRDNLPEFKDMVMEELKKMGDEDQASGIKNGWYSDLWLEMYDEYKKDGTDRLYFNAGTVIVISSNSPQAACIAAAHMETMIYTLGLGMLYSGFTTRAVAHGKGLQTYLKLKDTYSVHAVLVIGEPAVNYKRTVPRKAADVIMN